MPQQRSNYASKWHFGAIRPSGYFRSKEYGEILKKLHLDLQKIELLLSLIFTHPRFRSDVTSHKILNILESHSMARCYIKNILFKNTLKTDLNQTYMRSLKVSYAIGSIFPAIKNNSQQKIVLNKYSQFLALSNKALLICPKADVFELTQAAGLAETCKLNILQLIRP